ncbi:SRPBCC domain-containing protein [Brachybacterium alimentarium]|uniref:SRPBCC domain-containing protein n=1 Tax=Brachybacterium alimentarium TaxID=47845 RepID=UPI000DF2EF65|nr:SRPBCC domain-containing protein [Brachybacterium alimentarium]RCS87634.1 ATPase [Brachybacterium alimentarium]
MSSSTPTPETQLTEVTRTVAPAKNGNTVSLAQAFPVDPEELWSALTIGSHLEVWFGRATGEVVEGGAYTLPDMETHGSVLAVEAPRRLLLSWEFGNSRSEMELLVTPAEETGADGDAPAADVASAEAAAAGTAAEAGTVGTAAPRTRFELRHTVPADAHWATFGPAATGCGWDGALYGLALHLQDPSADLMGRLGRFASSPEGAEFTRATADAWYEAHVASGADKKPARKASVRTAAFYLGEEPDLS